MDNKRRIVVTGISTISSIGEDVNSSWNSILNLKTGILECTLYSMDGMISKNVGQIKSLNVSRPYNIGSKTRLVHIVEKTLKDGMTDAGINTQFIRNKDGRCQVFIGVSVGLDEFRHEYIYQKENGNKDYRYLTTTPDYLIQAIKNVTECKGAYHINSSACSASSTAIGEAFSSILNNKTDISVVIGADPLSEFSLYGFNSLKNISHTQCNPFSVNRDGITIGEGAAVLILEEYNHAIKRNANIYCEILGYGIGNDAYHETSPDPTGEGAYRTIKMALDQAEIDFDQIDYINMHGTGTLQNDFMELRAIEKLAKNSKKEVYVSSTKSLTGHCLGAAGAIELVFTILAVKNDIIPGNYNLEDAEKTLDNIHIVKGKSIEAHVDYAISNSFAFAGNSASIVIGKVK